MHALVDFDPYGIFERFCMNLSHWKLAVDCSRAHFNLAQKYQTTLSCPTCNTQMFQQIENNKMYIEIELVTVSGTNLI